MYREFTAIVAGELLPNQKFSFEDSHNATVFYALGVYTSYVDLDKQETLITLSHDTKFIMPASNALYLVTEPQAINVTLLRPGDRYLINSREVFTAVTVDDGFAIDPRLTRGQWVFIGIGDDSYHTLRSDNTVYRLPALVTTEPEDTEDDTPENNREFGVWGDVHDWGFDRDHSFGSDK